MTRAVVRPCPRPRTAYSGLALPLRYFSPFCVDPILSMPLYVLLIAPICLPHRLAGVASVHVTGGRPFVFVARVSSLRSALICCAPSPSIHSTRVS